MTKQTTIVVIASLRVRILPQYPANQNVNLDHVIYSNSNKYCLSFVEKYMAITVFKGDNLFKIILVPF